MKLKKNIQMRDYTQVNGYADEKPIQLKKGENMIVRNVAEEAKNRREEMIQRIKDCGQYLIDNAETILGEEKYMRELYVTCNFFDRSEPPYITINKDVIPDSFIERT